MAMTLENDHLKFEVGELVAINFKRDHPFEILAGPFSALQPPKRPPALASPCVHPWNQLRIGIVPCLLGMTSLPSLFKL